jgi:hypothetical protein
MRSAFSERFYEAFAAGFRDYVNGDWEQARENFQHVETVKGAVDFPTRSLLSIMGEFNFQAPDSWQGYRALTEK